MRSPLSRSAAAAATLALAGSALALAGPAAQAAPVFTDTDTYLDSYAQVYTNGGGCTGGNSAPGAETPVLENGPVVTANPAAYSTFTNPGDATDTAQVATQSTVSASVASVNGNVSTMDLTATGTSVVDTALATSACEYGAYSGAYLPFTFTVTTPGFLHFDFKSSAGSYSEVYLWQGVTQGPSPYYEHYGRGLKFAGKSSVYLPAGEYTGYFEGDSQLYSSVDKTVNTATSVHATFSTAGSQTAGVVGKGKKYVTLPAARSCATHTLAPSATAKKARAKKIKQITYYVNDAKVKKVKTPKKGEVTNLVVADDEAATLRAEVTLFPKKKGKKAKQYTVSASYEACS